MINKINKFCLLVQEVGLFKSIYWQVLKLFSKPSYDRKILEFLKKENNQIIDKYKNRTNSKVDGIKNSDCVWVFWWQGEEKMPELVKACYKSMKMHSSNHPVVLLTAENWRDYVVFPDYIIEKFEKGKINFTHFSDILRMCLLSTRGGIWVDATVFVTDNFTKELDGLTLFSRKSQYSTNFISNGKWTVYFIAMSKGNILASAVYEIFCNYWKKHNALIEYLLIDYVIQLLYNEIADIQKMIDAIPFNNENVHQLEKILDSRFDRNKFDRICQKTYIHKLNWKIKYKIRDEEDQLTFYGYVLH